MNKLRLIIVFETLVIIGLLTFIFFNIYHVGQNDQEVYCARHYYDSQVCLLSPRIYTNIIQPNNHLIINLEPLQNDLTNYISKNNLNVSVYIANLRDSVSFGINSSKSYPAASLNKLPIAVIILKKIEKGKLSLDTKLSIHDDDRDASSGELYKNPIKELSVRDLLYYMLAKSDNTATFVLQRKITKEDLDNLENYFNYYSNDVISQKSPLETTEITPKTASNMFASLYLSTALNAENSELILKDLQNTSFDIRKYANLPDNVVVTQKDGFRYINKDKYFHDCGILYVEDSRFSYCIMTKDIDIEKAQETVGVIVNKLYKFIIENKNKKITI